MRRIDYILLALSAASVALALTKPVSGNDNVFDIFGVEQRVSNLEARVDAIEKRLKCNCAETGKCLCEARTCTCPNCPEHTQFPQTKGTDVVSGDGREILFFTADWCAPCQAAKQRLGNLLNHDDMRIVDCTNGNPLAYKFGEQSYPTAIYLYDGQEISKCVGSNVGQRIVGGWLNPVAYGDTPPEKRYRQTYRSAPVYYTPRTYYTYPSYSGYYSYGGCATCR